MKCFLLPKNLMGINKKHWIEATGVSLGGFFYDYLCRKSGEVAGVRYWLDDMEGVVQHPVWGLFLTDPRFMFLHASKCIDMVFDDVDVSLLLDGKLHVLTMQDFGGDGVVSSGAGLGVVFVLPDGCQRL